MTQNLLPLSQLFTATQPRHVSHSTRYDTSLLPRTYNECVSLLTVVLRKRNV